MAEYKLLPEPAFGSLRFVKRVIDGRELRILQQYHSTWGQDDEESGVIGNWYDVPLVEVDAETG